MPTVSEEELQQLREQNRRLRERIASAQTKQAENDAERQREYEATQLSAENIRLEAQLSVASESAKVGNSKAGTASLMEQAKKQLEQAEAAAAQTAGPVDTNVDSPPKNTTGATVATEDKSEDKSDTNSNGGN